jgi:diacylglycerol O-acyltransferase
MTIDRLSDLDRVMVWASATWPQDIGALAILEAAPLLDSTGRLRSDEIRRVIEARLHLVPRFRQRIHAPKRGMGGPLWVDDPGFDVSNHIHQLPLQPPAGELELIDAVERLRRRPLDPALPLWDMWFLTGLANRRIGLYVRIHHSIADGMAAMATIAGFLDADPHAEIGTPRPWSPAPWPTDRDLRIDAFHRHLDRLVRSLSLIAHPRTALDTLHTAWPALHELLAAQPATKTSLDRMVGPSRRLALLQVPLDTIKDVAHIHGATVNDVILAATAGGLRTLLQSRGEPVDEITLRIYVPVSLRKRSAGPQQGNLIAQMAIPLQLGVVDPVDRLNRIAAETTRRKARAHTSLDVLMRGRLMRRLVLMAVMRQRVNATSASIPGPPVTLYLAGTRVLEVYPVLPLISNEPLGIGALSYAGVLSVGIVADGDAFSDLDVLASSMRNELESLQSSLATSAPSIAPPI